jgi:putative effector of murein hydrolase
MYLIFPFKKETRPNVFVSFIFLIIFVTIIITCALVLRKSTMFLPYISDIKKTYKLNHPPPIAMTFSLWRTINQLKKRSKYIQERIFEVSK